MAGVARARLGRHPRDLSRLVGEALDPQQSHHITHGVARHICILKTCGSGPLGYNMSLMALSREIRTNLKHATRWTPLASGSVVLEMASAEALIQAIHDELLREAAHLDHQQAECFVCVICSHGTKSGIYGTDGGTISLENVMKYFDGEHCKALQSKPKLFFIQACQGEAADRPGANETVDGGQDLSQLLEKVHISENGDQPDASKEDDLTNVVSIPTKSDILIACATHPGYVSLRNIHYGSWFIQAVIYVFQKFAYKEDIFGLLTLVNRLVASGRTALSQTGPRDVMQASMFTSSLNRKFLFFPGVIADTET